MGSDEPTTKDELIVEYGWLGTHPKYSELEWRFAVGSGDTRLGYWEWVESMLDFDAVWHARHQGGRQMKSGFKKFWYTATPGADTESDIACEICLDHELECIEAGDESKYGEIFDWMDLESTDELRYTEPWEICCCMCGELVEPEPGYGEEYDE